MNQVHGLILSGGQGSRLGGVDKGWVPIVGRPLVQHVLTRLHGQVHDLTISANRNLQQYSSLGFPVLPDDTDWLGMGPLAALATLHTHQGAAWQHDWLLVVPCDTPLLPLDLVQRLMQPFVIDPNLEVAYAQSPQGVQPSMMLVRCAALASVEPYLQSQQRSIRGWQQNLRHQAVVFDQAMLFSNANTSEAVRELENFLLSYA